MKMLVDALEKIFPDDGEEAAAVSLLICDQRRNVVRLETIDSEAKHTFSSALRRMIEDSDDAELHNLLQKAAGTILRENLRKHTRQNVWFLRSSAVRQRPTPLRDRCTCGARSPASRASPVFLHLSGHVYDGEGQRSCRCGQTNLAGSQLNAVLPPRVLCSAEAPRLSG